ncbi:flagellar hook-associated protein FlgL [Alkalicoccus urumqiensis]|uniref:Flagellar hook-associated protein 3 n=1 Tax=Alkalicoccus urumqiensis TaxID=1548213 RepID=A0A2P6MHC2_ALKUR|nr:flagellar hook-associated protein FlgL [Alkalicoccus urumqiensis]PRO65663.1 flagellar hook-associated protein 3 [Alkalicoccus urumqiensis]
MRVTQSMIQQSSLSNLSTSYEKLRGFQDQLSSGKKITRASQDPVVAMNGVRYRTQVTETGQFQRNLSEAYNWMETSDATLDKATNSLQRVRELGVQASNDSYESGQRANIAKEVAQLREHLMSLGNTKNNNKYIFNGTNTTNDPIDLSRMDIGTTGMLESLAADGADDFSVDTTYRGNAYTLDSDNTDVTDGTGTMTFRSGEHTLEMTVENGSAQNITYRGPDGDRPVRESEVIFSDQDAVSTNGRDVNIELLKGVNVNVNVNPQNVFSNQLFGDLKALENMLEDPDTETKDLQAMLDVVDVHINNSVNERAELGARVNRVEMIDSRVQEQEVIAKRIMSDNEDAEMEKVITDMMSQENVHRAALASGSRIIQPTLVDFLR